MLDLSYVRPDWSAPQNIHAVVTTRHSVSREKLTEALNLPSNPVWLNYEHGNNVVAADLVNGLPDADASYTQKKNVVCALITADCLPILICNKEGSCVAAVHAGWRGMSSGIIENAINAIPAKPKDLLVWFGPSISQMVYEVGEEVREVFLKHSNDASIAFKPSGNPDKWFADLYLIAKQRLMALGVNNISERGECTYSNPDKYYSFRRSKDEGRMISLIWMT